MSTTLRFSILGDSNVKRHLNPVNCRDRPLMSGSQLLPCGHLAVLAETLRAIREESNVVVVSCLTNFLTQSEEAGSVTFRIDPVLREAHQVICDFAVNHAEVSFIVAPPMYRLVPLWYRDGMPEVLIKFSETFRDKPPNVHLMQSFATPDLEGDGVHLTAYSGMEFMLHLFDASRALLENSQLPQDEVTNLVSEQARALEDRVVSLEQDHRRLNKSVEKKSAQDAELADFQENIRNESWIVVRGLAKLPEGLGSKEWQERAVKDVQGALISLMGGERKIIVVVNKTSRRKDAETRYHVQMGSLGDSKEIRDKFGAFFIGGGGDKRPKSLKKISISNLVTPATSVRVAIMKVLGDRYLASNAGSRAQVIKYESRPLLKLTPPSSASDRRVKTFNFIDAIKNLKTNFSKSELETIAKSVGEGLYGNLRSLFSVISDDDIKKRSPKPSDPRTTRSNSSAPVASQVSAPVASQVSAQGHISGVASGSSADLVQVDVPMVSASGSSPAAPSPPRSRGDKRGPSASPPRSEKSSKKYSKGSNGKK